MAVAVPVATYDLESLETVVRLAVAELRAEFRGDVMTTGPGGRPRTDGRAHPARGRVQELAIADSPLTGADPINGRDLSRALAVALRAVLGGDDVVVLRGEGFGNDPVVRKLVERLPSLVQARRRTLTQAHIDALVDAYLPADALASVMPDIEADNAKAQADFLATYPVLTAEEVADRAGHGAANRSATANRWKSEGRIFAVRAHGREAYPAFQFEDGRPRPALRAALQALRARSGWQTAFWFITPNGRLGGPPPIERLDDGAALASAAVHETEAWTG